MAPFSTVFTTFSTVITTFSTVITTPNALLLLPTVFTTSGWMTIYATKRGEERGDYSKMPISSTMERLFKTKGNPRDYKVFFIYIRHKTFHGY